MVAALKGGSFSTLIKAGYLIAVIYFFAKYFRLGY